MESMVSINLTERVIVPIAMALALKVSGSSAKAVIVDVPHDDQVASEARRVSSTRFHELDEFVKSRVADSKEFPFWGHVGMVGMGSGVYLGHGYVLTSAHVGCYPFCLADGSYYKPDYQSWTVLEDGAGGRSDVAIFRVEMEPDSPLAKLDALPISASPPGQDSSLLLFGSGLRQKADPSALRSQGKILTVLGYHLESKRDTTWGFNNLNEIPTEPVSTGDFRTHCFVTQFDRSAFEAQAADGDSGGATFIFNSVLKRWELAGCIIGVTQKGTYVPYGSRTFLANLCRYRSQIPNQDPENGGAHSDSPKADPVDLIDAEMPVRHEITNEGSGVRPAVVAVKIPS